MQKVFSTAEGKSAAVFNEPRTICYVIRVQAFNPKDEELQSRFESVLGDQRRLSMVAQSAFAGYLWIGSLVWKKTWNLPGIVNCGCLSGRSRTFVIDVG